MAAAAEHPRQAGGGGTRVGALSAPRELLGALTSTPATIRLSLHVLAATIWVGGQFTVAGLLPTLRSLGGDAPRRVAAAFSRLAWPAYGLLLVTGVWNIIASHPAHKGGAWHVALAVKIGVVALAGLSAALHQQAKEKAAIALLGALSAFTSIAALILGVLLAG